MDLLPSRVPCSLDWCILRARGRIEHAAECYSEGEWSRLMRSPDWLSVTGEINRGRIQEIPFHFSCDTQRAPGNREPMERCVSRPS